MSFDRVAHAYRLLETVAFGQSLQRVRVRYLSQIARPNRVLIVGEGNGRFLCELVRLHPKIDIDCVDSSARMLAFARDRIRRDDFESLPQIRFIHADILKWSSSHSYDLIVTHFFLDCFPRHAVSAIINKFAQIATSDATWLLADFTIPADRTLARLHAKLWLRVMYLFFRSFTGITGSELVDPSPYLAAHRFAPLFRETWRAGLLKSELWQRTEL